MSQFAADYLILTFVASLATIQIAATLGRLDGLLFIKYPLITRILGALIILGVFIWFFGDEPRNINDTNGGLDANAQAVLFAISGLTAVALTLVVASLINWRMKSGEPLPDEGFDALRKTNFYQALRTNLDYWSKHWRTRMKQYFSG